MSLLWGYWEFMYDRFYVLAIDIFTRPWKIYKSAIYYIYELFIPLLLLEQGSTIECKV